MLEVKNLSVRYGRHQALDRVSVKVDKGEVCVILGANGAGKSSLLKAIAGTVRVEPGSEIVMNGQPIIGMKAHLIVEQGIALVPEGPRHFRRTDGCGKSASSARSRTARARASARRSTRSLTLFPRLAERTLADRAHDVRRRAADGRDRPRADVAARNPDARRAVARPVAGSDQGAVPVAGQDRRDRRRHSAGRAECAAEPEDRRSRLSDRGRPDHRRGHGAKPDDRSGGGECLSRRCARRQGCCRRRSVCRRRSRCRSISRRSGASSAALALRAGAIRVAFVRALRQSAPLPSAFVGRYDPKKAGDPGPNSPRLRRAARVTERAGRARRQAARRSCCRACEGRNASPRAAYPLTAGLAREPICVCGRLRSGDRTDRNRRVRSGAGSRVPRRAAWPITSGSGVSPRRCRARLRASDEPLHAGRAQGRAAIRCSDITAAASISMPRRTIGRSRRRRAAASTSMRWCRARRRSSRSMSQRGANV